MKSLTKGKKNMSFLIEGESEPPLFADFVVFGDIILEIKATEGGICDEFISMLINYLKVSVCRAGLLVNFGRHSL